MNTACAFEFINRYVVMATVFGNPLLTFHHYFMSPSCEYAKSNIPECHSSAAAPPEWAAEKGPRG